MVHHPMVHHPRVVAGGSGETVMGNVLIILADEHSPRFMGCSGHPVVQTPNLDALAAAGVRFTNAYTPSPICVPARASFQTGRWVHRLGAWDSAHPYRGEVPGWAHAARDAGWTTTSVGKLHYGAVDQDHGFTKEILPMHVVNGVGWVQGLDRRPSARYPEAVEYANDVGIGESTYVTYDRAISAASVQWLADHGDDAEPWVLLVSFVSPHYPLTVPHQYWDRYESAASAGTLAAEIPPVDETHPQVQSVKDFFGYGNGFDVGPDSPTTEDGRRAYFGLCSFLDDQVGAVLGALDASGAADDTHVIFTSDHGDMAGNRGLWAKSHMFEDSVGIPMIMRGPGVPAGQVSDTPVNLVDVHPTVLALTTGVADAEADGESLLALASAANDSRVTFSEYHDGGSTTGYFMVRSGPWKYVHYEGARPQLFDLSADPKELQDLGTNPAYETVRVEMDATLRSIVDPAAADRQAFASQAALIEKLGGMDGLANAFRFNHTPAPTS